MTEFPDTSSFSAVKIGSALLIKHALILSHSLIKQRCNHCTPMYFHVLCITRFYIKTRASLLTHCPFYSCIWHWHLTLFSNRYRPISSYVATCNFNCHAVPAQHLTLHDFFRFTYTYFLNYRILQSGIEMFWWQSGASSSTRSFWMWWETGSRAPAIGSCLLKTSAAMRSTTLITR